MKEVKKRQQQTEEEREEEEGPVHGTADPQNNMRGSAQGHAGDGTRVCCDCG